MTMHVGDLVRLSGVSRHGKNRIRENGDMWRVLNVKDNSICVRPVLLERRENWRWVDLSNDEHMEIVSSDLNEPEHVINERKVDEAIERMSDQAQADMFNSEDWNWSGLR